MHDPKTSTMHISSILGQMVKKWEMVLPEGVRALEKFSRGHENVLLKDGLEKIAILEKYASLMRLKNFKGSASGQSIDLSAYAKVFEPISDEASVQKGVLSGKEASYGVSRDS